MKKNNMISSVILLLALLPTVSVNSLESEEFDKQTDLTTHDGELVQAIIPKPSLFDETSQELSDFANLTAFHETENEHDKVVRAAFDDLNAQEEHQMTSQNEVVHVCPPSPVDSSEPCKLQDLEKSSNAKADSADGSRVIIQKTRALVLVDSEEQMLKNKDLRPVSGLVIWGNLQLPGSYAELAQKLEPLFLDKPLTINRIKAIKAAIHDHFLKHDYPFTLVIVPNQHIGTNVLQLIVRQSKLGRIIMEGNKYADTCIVKNYFDNIQTGQALKISSIQSDLNFANRNPYRHVNSFYAPGREQGTTDLIVPVEARRPLRVYVGADNTGIPTIRRQRLFAGLGLDRVLAFDNNLNFQYTTAYEPNVFQSFTGQFISYLPWKNTLNLYGGYSVARSILPFPTATNKGTFISGSGRYTMPMVIGLRNPIEFTIGFDFKRTNSSVFFSELFPNTSTAANLSQFVGAMRWIYQGTYWQLETVAEVYYSPGPLLPDETDAVYNGLRPGATPHYIYGKGAIRYTQVLPLAFETLVWVRGQFANSPLLSSEQYGLGGYDTVRGYDDYQLNMDDAINANFEIRTPAIPIISSIRKYKIKDALQFLVFVDYGFGKNKFPLPGEASPSWLLGAGPGVRYTLDPNIALKVDWGWKLKKVPHAPSESDSAIPYTGGNSMVDFSATLSY